MQTTDWHGTGHSNEDRLTNMLEWVGGSMTLTACLMALSEAAVNMLPYSPNGRCCDGLRSIETCSAPTSTVISDTWSSGRDIQHSDNSAAASAVQINQTSPLRSAPYTVIGVHCPLSTVTGVHCTANTVNTPTTHINRVRSGSSSCDLTPS